MFDLAANGNRAGFVNLFPRVIADNLDFLRVVVDRFIYDISLFPPAFYFVAFL